MRHVNIRENRICKAQNKFNEINVLHISGKTNPTDIFTKEHKDDQTYMEIRNAIMAVRLDGGC